MPKAGGRVPCWALSHGALGPLDLTFLALRSWLLAGKPIPSRNSRLGLKRTMADLFLPFLNVPRGEGEAGTSGCEGLSWPGALEKGRVGFCGPGRAQGEAGCCGLRGQLPTLGQGRVLGGDQVQLLRPGNKAYEVWQQLLLAGSHRSPEPWGMSLSVTVDGKVQAQKPVPLSRVSGRALS